LANEKIKFQDQQAAIESAQTVGMAAASGGAATAIWTMIK
jgi:hypothetical protein